MKKPGNLLASRHLERKFVKKTADLVFFKLPPHTPQIKYRGYCSVSFATCFCWLFWISKKLEDNICLNELN